MSKKLSQEDQGAYEDVVRCIAAVESRGLSPEAQEAYEVIALCIAAIPVKPFAPTLLKDFPGSVIIPETRKV